MNRANRTVSGERPPDESEYGMIRLLLLLCYDYFLSLSLLHLPYILGIHIYISVYFSTAAFVGRCSTIDKFIEGIV